MEKSLKESIQKRFSCEITYISLFSMIFLFWIRRTNAILVASMLIFVLSNAIFSFAPREMLSFLFDDIFFPAHGTSLWMTFLSWGVLFFLCFPLLPQKSVDLLPFSSKTNVLILLHILSFVSIILASVFLLVLNLVVVS